MVASRAKVVFLSLGSNIEPRVNLVRATSLLASKLQVMAASHVFETLPVGAAGESVFLNAAVQVCCSLSPADLKFQVLRPLEEDLGRKRSADRNAPRTIDLDISLFGDRVVEDPAAGLRIPDPEILLRAHVALPLADLAPDRRHPVTGERMSEIAARFEVGDEVHIVPGLALWPQSSST